VCCPRIRQAEVLKFVEDLAGLEAKADNGHPAGRVAIWDKIEEIMRDVPDGSFGKHSYGRLDQC